jgi:acyl-[acyl-carrier-protein]-phospholipid O-acyltransferase/long-chain-fatty-acid--[acyl-carrier-protein] ligase
VLTAHRFIEQGKLHDLVDALETLTTVTYLEDVRATSASPTSSTPPPRRLPQALPDRDRPSDPGVILFTSGSFGAPRGVVLSQQNLVANVRRSPPTSTSTRLGDVQPAADLPLLRPDRRRAAADPRPA